MGSFNVNPTTILGKIHVRTPTQAEPLSSRYTFLNVNNAEPNLGKPPGIFGGTYYSTLTSDEYLGIRYALLSNNHSGSAWRVWAYDNPRIAAYSKEGSLGIGDNAYPLNIKSFVYSNYAFDNQNNRYNSQSFSNKTFNVFALSGIYLFDSTTIGDPASAIAFIVTDTGNVGVGLENPSEKLTVVGNISARDTIIADSLSARFLGLVHNPPNDSINPTIRIGETDTSGFSGVFISYIETTNTFGLSTLFSPAPAVGTIAIDRFGNVGINTNDTSEKLTVAGNISASNSIIANTLSARYLNLLHTPANDGTNPYITIGETDNTNGNLGFSGAFISYDETTNIFGISSIFTPTSVEAFTINRFGNIGIKTNDGANALTVKGAISASQGITVGTRTSLPGISAATLVHATTALTLSITDIFLKINISGKDYALPLYNYTT
jgi:hypothetical protein